MKKLIKICSTLIISLNLMILNGYEARSAEKLFLFKGNFSRNISIKNLEEFTKSKKASGTIYNLIQLTGQKEKVVAELLTQEIELPLTLTSKLIYSKIGAAILEKIGEIIYPHKFQNKEIIYPALRSAIIKSIVLGEEKVSIIKFLKAYPNKNVTINLNKLDQTLLKVESMSELLKFFSNSPLEKLKEGSSKT
tara:strand:+ start:848 stop:1426 length:579 start_codon:yes stop_codon:yes gene_type:complete